MCGICGYKLLREDHAEEAMVLFEQLLLQCQIRGKHATGVSAVWKDSNRIMTKKASVCAREFVSTPGWDAFKVSGPVAVIGHTRYSTSGDPEDNMNNQPLSTRSLSIVHNGLVSMATKDEFEEAYGIEAATSNDSEIILRKVLDAKSRADENYRANELTSFSDAIAEALQSIHEVDPPIFACGFLSNTGSIHIVRDHIRPLWLFYIKEWGMVGFASTRDIIRRAFKKAATLGHDPAETSNAVWEADPYTVYELGPRIKSGAVHLPFCYPSEHRFERPQLIDRKLLSNKKHTNNGTDLSLVGGTKQGDHRHHLRESFKRYSAAAIASWEIDPNYPLMNYLFRRYELSKSQEFWACYLYGVFYHPGTVFYVMQEFPEFEKVDVGRLERWHTAEWKNLRYNTDRKWEKGHFVEMFLSYRDLMGGQHPTAQEDFFNALLTDDPIQSFHNVFKALSKLLRFGRYATYIYTEALARCMGMPIQADTVFLKEADSSRNGLCYATNRADWVDAKLTKDQFRELEADLGTIMDELRKEYPTVTVDHWFIESCLCAYKGFFRSAKGRYLGYYLHRMADEILQMQRESITKGIEWDVLWQFRKECMPWEYLGELSEPPILKVHKPYEHVLRDKGHMIGLWPMIKRGIVPNTPIGDGRVKTK